MTMGIGLDVVNVPDFEARLEDPFFLTATFTESERAYCDSQPGALRRAHSYAGRFAAKEAFIKAADMSRQVTGSPVPEYELRHIEVVASLEGPPRLVAGAVVAEWLRRNQLRNPLLSISHDGPTAAAVVLLARSR